MTWLAGLATQRWARYLAGAVAVVGLLFLYGEYKEREGARSVTIEFLKRDLEGAENVRGAAREILDSIGDDVDVDELLRSTGGLRD